MIRVSGVLLLTTGERVPFAGGPREFSAWERYALAQGLPTSQTATGSSAGLTMMWFLAYACSTRGAEHRPGFDDWLDTLADLSEFELEMSPPTQAVPSAESSPNSPPVPESHRESSGQPIPQTSPRS